MGLLSSLTKPNGATVSYEYDAAHRLVAETDAQGNRRELELNDLGNPVEERLLDALGQTRWIERRIFNEIGWLSSVSDAYSNQSSFSYDVVANLIQETSPSGNTHSTSTTASITGHKRPIHSGRSGALQGYRRCLPCLRPSFAPDLLQLQRLWRSDSGPSPDTGTTDITMTKPVTWQRARRPRTNHKLQLRRAEPDHRGIQRCRWRIANSVRVRRSNLTIRHGPLDLSR